MMEWTTACPDWERRIVTGRSLVPFKPLFPHEAAEAVRIFKELRIVDVPGQPTFGESCEQWVFDFVGAIFGAYDPDAGRQMIREFLLLISKKNTKSTLAAGIMVTALLLNERHSEELLILAPTIEVAQNSFKPAAAMVRAEPELEALLHVQDHMRTITHRINKAALKVVAADSDTVSGKKAGRVLVDELWVFGKRPHADAMLREATGGLVSRPEGFVIYLSTQSDEPPAGVFKAKLDYYRDIRDGKIEDKKSFGLLYEFPAKMLAAEAYLEPENFYVTNPNMGRSVDQEWLEDELKKASDPDARRVFLAKHLNVEIGMNLRANRWPGADYWQKGETTEIGCTLADLGAFLDMCEVVVPGLDGGGLDDLYGLTLVGRHKVTNEWISWAHAWAHEGVLERRKSIAARLLDFKKAGELTIVSDQLEDISAIVEIIRDVKERGLLACVAADAAGLGEMIEELAEIGITQEAGLIVAAPQGIMMMNAIKTTERRLANGTFKHAKSAMLSWCATNLKIEATATAIRATKQNAGDAKIDPMMALFNAVTVMVRNPESQGGPSVYEERGIRMI